ncbi:hypothetical protein WMY93_001266 [Mugilogobius chulae]|uniref:GPCR family 2 latrophilin C-terminal domain-containing protein n=1 Tax=Mugilogobius chulae TaxID=88201 RepID=A0AAW0Q3A8_9GOBI
MLVFDCRVKMCLPLNPFTCCVQDSVVLDLSSGSETRNFAVSLRPPPDNLDQGITRAKLQLIARTQSSSDRLNPGYIWCVNKSGAPPHLSLSVCCRQHSLSHSRDISAMDTLPLNGNFNNSYSLRDDDYESVRAPADLGGLNLNDAAFEKMIISEIVHNNLRPRGAPKGRHVPSRERERPPHTRAPLDQGSGSEDDAIVADHTEASSPQRGPARGGAAPLELLLHTHHKEVLEAPLLPQRTHSLLYSAHKAPRRLEGPGPETDTVEDTDSQSPNNRDSLYTSMPNLKDSPSASPYPPEEEELSHSPRSDTEDAYRKSMPELGDEPPPLSYYHIHRAPSDGCILPLRAARTVLRTVLRTARRTALRRGRGLLMDKCSSSPASEQPSPFAHSSPMGASRFEPGSALDSSSC